MTDHYLYVIEFSDDVVKVGRTQNPQARLRAHASAARLRNAEITRDWLSPTGRPLEPTSCDEDQLIGYCADRWSLAWGHEYFTAADFDQITQYAASLRGADACSVGLCRPEPADEDPFSHLSAARVARFLAVAPAWLRHNYRYWPHHHCGRHLCFTSAELREGLQARSNYPIAA